MLNGTDFPLNLYGGKSLVYRLSSEIVDPIGQSIREGTNPFFNNFLFLADKYAVPLAPGECVIDCGANIGCCAIAFALLGHAVYAFEADPLLADHIVVNAVRNGLFNLTTIPSAVGEQVGTVFFQTGGAYGHIVEGGAPAAAGRPVPCTSLDAWAERDLRFKVGLIKMDVEGAELGVLKGARKLLVDNLLPTILIEINSHTLGWFDVTATDIFDFATDLGYRLFRLEVDGLRPMPQHALEPETNVDYLFISPKRLAHFSHHLLPPWSLQELTDKVLGEINHSHPHHRDSIRRKLKQFSDVMPKPLHEALASAPE